MTSYRCDDWSDLPPGVHVEIRMRGKTFGTGAVETVSPGGTLLWLSTDHNGTRALFEAAEGYEVWLDPVHVPPDPSLILQRQPLTPATPNSTGTIDSNPQPEGGPTSAMPRIVSATDPASRDLQLDRTCARLIGKATDCGILVTRVNHARYEIALHPDVPYGFTYELDLT